MVPAFRVDKLGIMLNQPHGFQRIARRRRPSLRPLQASPALRQEPAAERRSFFGLARPLACSPASSGLSASAVAVGAGTAVFALVAAAVLLSGPSLPAETERPSRDLLADAAMASYAGFAAETAGVPAAGPLELDMVETFAFETYIVKSGDTISGIAQKNSLDMGTLIAVNGLTNAKKLQAGAELKIPNMDGLPYSVRKGDSLNRIAGAWGIPVEAILDANDLSTAAIMPGSVLFLPGAKMDGDELKLALGDLFRYPVKGRLTSGYGWRDDPFTGARRFHAAIDLAAALGTPVRAAMDGRVSTTGTNAVYGKYVILSHAGGYQTMYAHLDEFRTVKGKKVAQGDRIGDMGSTGLSTGSHVHFAVYRNGRAINPLTVLAKK